MKVKVSDIVSMLNEIAPFETAEPWDNVGLLVGSTDSAVTNILTALDVTPQVISEAKKLGAQMIVTHHPLIFAPRKRVTDEDPQGRMILDLAREEIALASIHTNYDIAAGGVNDALMHAIGMMNVTGEGLIRVADLAEGVTLDGLSVQVQQKLHTVARTYGAHNRPLKRLACCSGAGTDYMDLARAAGADVFLTGEVKHHQALEAMGEGMSIIEAGHYETENPAMEVLSNALQNRCNALEYRVSVFYSQIHPFE